MIFFFLVVGILIILYLFDLNDNNEIFVLIICILYGFLFLVSR